MFLGMLVLLTALSISAVAIYYSVAGLVAIFAAAALPIMIMGGVLEVGKLVTAVWLHRYWSKATWWLKTYLSLAVFILMLITSMGIFGFLSKAHIEQTSQSTDNLAQVESLQTEIDRNLVIIGRAENKIRQLDSSQSNTDNTIQEQIDKEQERIDTAYDRVQPLVDEQNKNLKDQIALFGLDKVDTKIRALETAQAIDTKDRDAVRNLQSIVGAKPDGAYGSGTAAKVEEYRSRLNAEREDILTKIQNARQSTNLEISKIRQRAEDQIAESNKLINRLREQLGAKDNARDVQVAIDEQNVRIKNANNVIEQLTEEKIGLESEYRKLEAEVGPIKYIAEFVYGSTADNNMLEEAVRWVIITIIFVFDPLAVLLLIASQYTFEWRRKDDDGDRLRQYEQARAQRIVENPGYNIEDPKEDTDENSKQETGEEKSQDAEELRDGESEESVPSETGDDPVVATESPKGEIDEITTEERSSEIHDGDRFSTREDSRAEESVSVGKNENIQSDEISKEETIKRQQRLVDLDDDKEWSDAKSLWKHENPDESIKTYKDWYVQGKINDLPWAKHLKQNVAKKYILKDSDGKQKTETAYPSGYEQNSEQSTNTLWQKIRDKD